MKNRVESKHACAAHYPVSTRENWFPMCYDLIRVTVLKPVVFHMNPFCSSEASTKKVRLWGWIRTIDGQIDDSARPLVLLYATGADRFDGPAGQAACGLNKHPRAPRRLCLRWMQVRLGMSGTASRGHSSL